MLNKYKADTRINRMYLHKKMHLYIKLIFFIFLIVKEK